MNRWKICSGFLALAVCAICIPAAQAQSIPVVGVGSSAIFPSAAIAATVGDPVRGISSPLCGSRFWTGSASAVDARATLTTPNIPNEGGTLWVAWDNDTTPTIICAYLSVDSIVGQRLFFGQGSGTAGNATLLIPTSACTTAGGNKIAFVWDTATSGLPVAVWNALEGGNSPNPNCSGSTTSNPVHFNVAFTDIRPEDAQFVGNQRVLCTDSNASAAFPPDDKSCLGFNTGSGVNPGTAVTSSVSTASAQAIFYAFSGTDPISGTAIPSATIFSVGAESIIPVVNTIDTSAAGLGTLTSGSTPTLTSVSSHSLSAVYSGNAVLTRDLVGGSGLGSAVLHALQREPMSGTFTTFEWQVIRQRDGANFSSQESGICGPTQSGCYVANCFVQASSTIPSTACSNPVNTCIGASCGLRMRVIGTGQMVSTLNNATWTVGGTPGQTPSFIGYAFWSLGSFGGKANIKYLALDGVDGLFPGYSTTDGGHTGGLPGVPVGQGTVSNGITVNPGQCGGYFNGNGGSIQNFSCNAYALPTFDHLQDGTYRAWNILRGAYYGAAQTPNFSPLNIAGFVLGAQDQAAPVNANRIPDFFPTAYSSCSGGTCSGVVNPFNQFRSHYAVSSWGIGNPNNGIVSGTENGGDVAGAVFNTQIEKDFGSIFSNSFLTWVQ